jgi:hypothetical protein
MTLLWKPTTVHDAPSYVISSNVDHENDWTLRERAGRLADVVIRFAKAHLVKLSKGTVSSCLCNVNNCPLITSL